MCRVCVMKPGDLVEPLLQRGARVVLVAVDDAGLQRRVDLAEGHRRRARAHQLDRLDVDRRLDGADLQAGELRRIGDVARSRDHVAEAERVAPGERPHADRCRRGSRRPAGPSGRRRRGARGPSRATGTGSRAPAAAARRCPRSPMPETMKSIRPSWTCWTVSRSWPSVPLAKTRTITAPLVVRSTISLKVWPSTCSDVGPAVIECDRRRMRRPPSRRERQPAASAAAPTPERNARRPMTWFTQEGLCRSPGCAHRRRRRGATVSSPFVRIAASASCHHRGCPAARPMDAAHATLRCSRDRRDCRGPRADAGPLAATDQPAASRPVLAGAWSIDKAHEHGPRQCRHARRRAGRARTGRRTAARWRRDRGHGRRPATAAWAAAAWAAQAVAARGGATGTWPRVGR